MKNIILLFFLIGTTFALQAQDKSADLNHDGMAQEICECSNDMLDLIDQLEETKKTGDRKKAMEIMDQLDATKKGSQKCTHEIHQKYSHILRNTKNKDVYQKAIEDNCPRLAALIFKKKNIN